MLNSKFRQSIYYISTAASALVSFFLLWNGLDAGTADGINEMIGGLTALLIGSGSAVAATTVKKQRAEGLFDTKSPADLVISSVKAVVDARDKAVFEVDKVRKAVSDTVGDIPILGPLAQQAMDDIWQTSSSRQAVDDNWARGNK